MQADVAFTSAGHVNGTLKHVENWTQFSADPRYNTGNFMCFKMSATEAGTTFAAGLQNHIDPTRPEWVSDPDGEFIFQISNKATQILRLKYTNDGVEHIYEYDLNGLTLESE